MKVINVFMCLRNNANSIEDAFERLNSLEKSLKSVAFRYYIYENDSSDTTPEAIETFMKTRKGHCSLRNSLGKSQWESIRDKSRIADMAMYRNSMRALCTDYSDSDYSVVLDSEIEFTCCNVLQLLSSLDENKDIAMATPFVQINVAEGVKFKGLKRAYCDTYALQTFDGKRTFLRFAIKPLHNVKSAFGGLCVIRSSVLAKCSWDVPQDQDGKLSEHVYFCEKVRQHGRVVIVRDVCVKWGLKITA